MNTIELKQILAKHLLWLKKEPTGTRAVLSGADLRNAVLRSVDLRDAVLSGADLRNAVLRSADLRNAVLSGADLRDAVLRDAVLRSADLRSADLRNADLRSAVLRNAVLSGADLRDAVLRDAVLSGADLSGADLSGADLPFYSIVPEIGPFYTFKKLQNGVVATLYVPRSAQRMNSLVGRKCRVSKAKVVALSTGTEAIGIHDFKFVYKVGSWVTPDSFDDDIRIECTHGIHCFITKKEAEEYT